MGSETDRPDLARDTLLDELLVVRCQLGEPPAFDELVERWHGPLWRYLRGLFTDQDAAAETLQDAWLRILRALPRLRDPARLKPWLFTIARRTAMDRLRRQYSEPASMPIDEIDVAAEVDSQDAVANLAAMRNEIARMPLTEREVLVLFHLEGLTLEELAAVLDVPVGTIKSRLFRARRLLRRQMTGKGVD